MMNSRKRNLIIICFLLFSLTSTLYSEEKELDEKCKNYIRDFFANVADYKVEKINILEENKFKGEFLTSQIPSGEYIPLLL
ncbi:MAG: hypothetical protein ACP5KS_09925, partial [Candidatus Hydrogenedens sp.]